MTADATDDINAWLNRLKMSVGEVSRLYDPERAPNIEKRLKDAYYDFLLIYKRLNEDLARLYKNCAEPWTIHDMAPECEGCPNFTMAIDGRPMCAVTRRALF